VLEQLRQERAAVDRHQGRVRAFPHKAGNYATHVYIARTRLLKLAYVTILWPTSCMCFKSATCADRRLRAAHLLAPSSSQVSSLQLRAAMLVLQSAVSFVVCMRWHYAAALTA